MSECLLFKIACFVINFCDKWDLSEVPEFCWPIEFLSVVLTMFLKMFRLFFMLLPRNIDVVLYVLVNKIDAGS